MSANTSFTKAVWVIFLVVSLMGLFFSGKWGIAAVSNQLAMNQLSSWQAQQKVPNKSQWQWTFDALKLAVFLDEDDAAYQNNLGRFYEFTADMIEEGREGKQGYLDDAITSFRLATQLSPAWAIPWSNLALLKHKRGQIDDELIQAMRQSLEFGGSLRPVQMITAEVGVAHWNKLPRSLQQSVLNHMHYILNSRDRFIFIQIIQSYRMMPFFCLVFEEDDKVKFCKKKL